MKITQFDDTYTQKVGAGETTLVSGSSGGSNSAFGGDVTGSAGSLSVVGLRQTVSLSSNMGDNTVGTVLTTIQSSPWLAAFAVSSNSGGGSFGSNATRVSASSFVGASANGSREDHRHDGIGTVTASSSNTLDRGTLNLRAGSNVALALTDSDGSGGFDTVTISASATGGASGVSSIAKSGSSPLTGAVTLTGGTNVTLTQSGNDISIAATSGGGGVTGSKPVQSKTQAGSTSTNSLALTMDSTPTNGNVLFLISGRDDNGTISSITQTNVTWTQLATSTAAPRVEIWKGIVAASASASITVAYSTTSFTQYVVGEFAGITGTLGASAVFSGSTTLGSQPMTPTIVPASASMLVIGGMTTTSNGNNYAASVHGNLLPFEGQYNNTMRMLAVYGFPGTVPAAARAAVGNNNTISSAIVTVT